MTLLFPRERAQKPGHLEIKSWPWTQGAWPAFAQSCACLAPGDGELGPSSMLGVGVSQASAG